MKSKKHLTQTPDQSQQPIKQSLALFLWIASTLFILLATLQPFNFQLVSFSFDEIINDFMYGTTVPDIIANLILFIPYGFAFACVLPIKRLGVTTVFILVMLASLILSLTVETLQIFLPSRNPAISDLITNTISGGLGFILLHPWRWLLIKKIRQFFRSPQKISLLLIAYLTVIVILSSALPATAKLNNWSADFPLSLGNEATGDRPWQGSVKQFYLANRVLSKTELSSALAGKNPLETNQDNLLAAYQISGESNYQDQTGQLPDLVWQEQPTQLVPNNPLLSAKHWLTTKNPVNNISEKVAQTSQFTLVTTLATANTNQQGPARIISLSKDTSNRNFTLGQQYSNLVFRIRTPLTGDNASTPQLVIPRFFKDTQAHNLVISYDGSTVHFYFDHLQNNYELPLIPGIAFYEYLYPFPHSWGLYLTTAKLGIYNLFYYELVFIPLGFLLALVTIVFKEKPLLINLLIVAGIFLVPYLLELMLTTTSGKEFSIDNLLVTITITISTTIITKIGILSWRTVKVVGSK